MTEINQRQQRLTHFVLMTIALGLGLGCATANAAKKEEGFFKNPDGIEISKAELRIRVRSLAIPFSGIIEDAADGIIADTTDPEIRKLALLWKINGIPAMQAALFQAKPLAALLDAWALTIQTSNSLQSGPASNLPDEVKARAMKAITMMESEILGIANLLGPSDAVGELRADVETWARNHPITTSQTTRTPTSGELARLTADNKIGLRKTVVAVNETMDDLASRMDVYTNFLPKQARWQAEYMVGEMMGGEDLGTVVSEFTELSNAIEAMAETVNDAPTLIAGERTAVLAALQGERIAAIQAINQQMQEAFEFVTHERVEAFTTHLKEERIAVLEAMTAERIAALEALREERIATLEQVESMTDTLVADSLKRLIDHAFIRLAQLGIVVLIIVGIGYLLIRRRPSHA
jgi:hypothetical protein